MRRFQLLLMALLCPAASLLAAEQKPFELRDGDRVVFVGDTLIEREQHFGWVELMMTLKFPDRNITFRNLGWSADTPDGISRVSFDWQKGRVEWLQQLLGQIKQTQPTVVMLGYGMASSFDGAEGLERFKTSYNALMDGILEQNKGTRLVLLTPVSHERLPTPLPNPAPHNDMIALYAQAIREMAAKREAPLVDLSGLTSTSGVADAHTDNGIHLNSRGYEAMARAMAKALGWPNVDLGGREALRQAILKKNRLFFHRWRPENSTYLFLFRKHEQGKNAQEIPQFDPLVHAEEEKIAALRRAEPNRSVQLASRPAQNPVTDNPATPIRPQSVPEFQLADENLEITLWAENPLLAKPIAMNWDARGRLWVASSSVYPQIAPGQAQEDKIVILEDTNRDNRADKATVFADGLLIPTGVEPGDGGCYVGQSTELLHFKDTDGDGLADERRVVLSGFGTEDTHHILHTLRWAPDGQLHMNQSIYIHSHLETPNGVVRLNSGGTLTLRPETLEVGIHMKGLINGWGHDFDSFGQSFQTDGAGGQGINWTIPQAMYVTYAGARRILGSVSPGGYPKFCGLELIRSAVFPKQWQGNAITCDFRANRIVRFEILEQGSAYTTRQHEFLRTTNITFRPVDVKLGPDGALYIADWSNPIIQHGEVDFRDPRRDRVHGRIWRITHKAGRKVEIRDLTKETDAGLLANVTSSDGWTQRQARRLLTERALNNSGETTRKEIAAWTASKTEPTELLESLWLHQATRQVNMKLLGTLMEAQDGRVRAAAVRALGAWAGNTPGIKSFAQPPVDQSTALDLLARRIADDHPRVRIEALRALARIPTGRAAHLALSVLDHGEVDGFLDYALWLTINDLAEPWIAAIESGEWKVEGRDKQLQYALKAIEPKLASGVMAKVFGGKPLPRDGSGGNMELIGQAGGPQQLRQLFDQVLSDGFTEPAAVRALNALSEAGRLRNARPSGDVSAVTNLLHRGGGIAAAAAKLAGTWKLASVAPALAKLAENADATLPMRRAAIDGLRDLGGRPAIAALRDLAAADSAEIRRSAAAALAATDLEKSMSQILSVLSGINREDESLELWRSMLAVKGAPAIFAKAVGRTNLPEVVARAGVRVSREAGRSEPDLVLALNKAGGLTDATASLTDEEIHNISYNVTRGDPARGEMIYRRKDVSCVVCHSIGGAGGKVGPDMTSLGASTPVADYIVESVLLPNKKVKEGFNSVLITTSDDEEVAGNLVREDNEQVILRDVTNREISVPKRTIKERRASGSLMPAGLVDLLSPQERLDLYAFLAHLGKPGPFDATKQNVARTWYLNPNVGTINADKMLQSDLRGREWTPLYSTAAGYLPKTEIQAELPGNVTFWAATRFQTAKAGPVRLAITGTVSPKVWVDGRPVGGDEHLEVELPAGVHTFFIKITASDLTGPLRLESPDATFLTE